MEVAQVPSDRIVIVGQSLGAAVTTAVIEHFAKEGTEFAWVILIAGFTQLQTLLTDYSILGWLSPLRPYPQLLKFFTDRISDKWASSSHLANFVRLSKRVRLFIMHSKDDYEIPWYHADELFAAAVNATTDDGMDLAALEQIKNRNTMDMGDGAFIRTWKGGEDKIIREEVVSYGC
jgi:abhydrolase domain-containing protein 12